MKCVKVMVCHLTTAPSLPVWPQRGRSGPGALREAAALQPPQVQLLPLRAGAVRPAGPAGGGGEDHLCGLCGEGQGGGPDRDIGDDYYIYLVLII